MSHLLSTTKFWVSFFSQQLAFSTSSCLLLSHSYSFFIAGQYYLTRLRLNLNTPFIWKTPTPSTLKNCKHKQYSFHGWESIKMFSKLKSSRKKRNVKLWSQKRMPLFSARILRKSENKCGKEKKGLSPHFCFSSKDDFHISHGKIRQRNSRFEYCMGRCEMRKSSVQFKDGKV